MCKELVCSTLQEKVTDVEIRLFGSAQAGFATGTSDIDLMVLRQRPEGLDGYSLTREQGDSLSKAACANITGILVLLQECLPEKHWTMALDCSFKNTVEFKYFGQQVDLHIAQTLDMQQNQVWNEALICVICYGHAQRSCRT